ncbi:amidase [Vibrio hippocampi]|uniref:2-amino-5-chloromuconic acid deaminase n=1 Tax=Vibrio hippocampi TaxID=654686 RepID=A0ABM8ZN16_9VIBR|nr:amidase [Vibrio hippocampi]CAH0529241.1 2-amino-5-chloromuconic acid deaminase [Vibrio hippocampi]
MERDRRVYCTQGPERLEPLQSGRLDGLSFVFKDLFDVEGYVTGAGNPAWLDSHDHAQSTTPLILDLLSDGALCQGRVQTDELAYSLNGINVHYGTPINPVAPDSLPGGSSSGSAVAVASGDVDFAIGTDTGGSVRVPASYCGLYGLRPTLGGLSLEHSFTLSQSFDTAGIFSRELTILSQVFQTLRGESAAGSAASRVLLDTRMKSLMGPERLARLSYLLDKADIQLVEKELLAEADYGLEQLSFMFRTIQGYEIIQRHEAWLQQWQHTLAAPIQERVAWSRQLTRDDYLGAQKQQAEFTQWLTGVLADENAQLLLPTTPGAPPKLTMPEAELAQYRSDLMGLTSLAGLAGLPQLHIPLHSLAQGPAGFSLLGSANSEVSLIATASRLITGDA